MQRSQRRRGESGNVQPTHEASAALRWWSRLLDDGHRWGSHYASAGRHGVRRYRLIIYPPGASSADRQLARLWRAWPISGAVLAALAVMLLGNVAASPGTVLALAVTVHVASGALLFLRAGPARVQVRSMTAVVTPGDTDAGERSRYTEWQTLVDMLTRADRTLTTGAISLLEHEAIWREAYDRLDVSARVAHR